MVSRHDSANPRVIFGRRRRRSRCCLIPSRSSRSSFRRTASGSDIIESSMQGMVSLIARPYIGGAARSGATMGKHRRAGQRVYWLAASIPAWSARTQRNVVCHSWPLLVADTAEEKYGRVGNRLSQSCDMKIAFTPCRFQPVNRLLISQLDRLLCRRLSICCQQRQQKQRCKARVQ